MASVDTVTVSSLDAAWSAAVIIALGTIAQIFEVKPFINARPKQIQEAVRKEVHAMRQSKDLPAHDHVHSHDEEIDPVHKI